MKLTNLQCSILLALARYRFMTCSQLQLANLGSLSSIRKAIRALSFITQPAKIIDVHTFSPSARYGKLEHVYTITEYGLVFLHEMSPNYVSDNTLSPILNIFELDYHHRWETVSFRIRLENSLKEKCAFSYSVESFCNYFEKYGANHSDTSTQEPLQAATKTVFSSGGYFIPDSIFVLEDGAKRGLFTVECVMGPKTSRTITQIERHQKALAEGPLSEQYKLGKQDFRALFFFQNENNLLNVLKALRAKKSWPPFDDHIYFATTQDIARDALGCWRRVLHPEYRYNYINSAVTYRDRT